MIQKTIRQMLLAQVLSALTVSLCLLIDNMMIGNFIGVEELTAYGLANPLLLMVGAVASMLSNGVQVVCSRSLAKGQTEETNKGYSTAVLLAGSIAIAVTLLVILFRHPVASLLGANGDTVLHRDTSDYLLGFVIGAPATMGALILIPFLQMAGKNKLLIYSVLGMTLADIGLDYLFAVPLKMGMLGMGLASSISFYVALIIGGFYFVTPGCVFRFSIKGFHVSKLLELLKAGIPTVVNMATAVIFSFFMNRLLLQTGGSTAVAAYAVINTLGGASNCISTGSGSVSLTLSSMFFNEEDRTGLRQLLSSMMKYSVLMGILMTAFIVLLAPGIVSLFLPEAGQTQRLAILGIRCFSCGLTFSCINNAIRGTWQGCEHILMTNIVSVLQGFLLPAAAAFVLSRLSGTSGIWLFFALGELLTLVLILVFNARKLIKQPSVNTLLMLRDGFGVSQDDLIESDIQCITDVMNFSQAASAFCLAHGQDQLTANRICLCIEEMGTNTINYGMNDGKKHHLNIRVLFMEERWILRFRDDCHAFNPVDRIPGTNQQENLGIRLLIGMSKEIRYTYSLNLNNLTIIVR